jgi:hypothetical protein
MFIKLLPYILVVSAILSILGYTYWKGGADKEDKIILKDLQETVKDQEALNEIRNNRPDDDELINSLLSGTF